MTLIAQDDFSDVQTDSWGDADVGGTYTYDGTGTEADVDKTGSVGQMIVNAATNSETMERLDSVSATDVGFLGKVRVTAANADVLASGLLRYNSGTDYAYLVGIWFESDGTTTAVIREKNGGGPFSDAFATGQGSYTANEFWWVRGEVIGNYIRVRVWKDGTTEPTAWQVNDRDDTITAAGGVGTHGLITFGGTARTLEWGYWEAYSIATGVADDFSDAASSSWGSADTGGSWTVDSPTSDWNKASGVGTIALDDTDSFDHQADLTAVDMQDIIAAIQILPVTNPEDAQIDFRFRVNGSDWVGCYILFSTSNQTFVGVVASDSIGDEVQLANWSTSDTWWLKFYADENGDIYAKAWKASGTEPATWDVTDTTSVLASGAMRLPISYGGSGSGQINFDNLQGWEIHPPPISLVSDESVPVILLGGL